MSVLLVGGPADGRTEEVAEPVRPYTRILVPVALTDDVCVYEATREGTAIYLATIDKQEVE